MIPGLNAAAQMSVPRGSIEIVDATINRSTTTSNTVSVPSHKDGDLLVAVCYYQPGVPTMTPPAGWTLVGDVIDATVRRVLVYQRVASSEPLNYTFTWGAGTEPNIVSIVSIRRASGVTDVGATLGGSQQTATAPSITASSPGVLLAYFNVVQSRTVQALPAGMTKLVSVEGATPTHVVCALPKSPAGATGDKIIEWNTTGSGSSGIQIQVG